MPGQGEARGDNSRSRGSRLHAFFGWFGGERRGQNPIWLTVYSDMITNLTLFFLMMFAITRLGLDEQTSLIGALEKYFRREEVKQMTPVEQKKVEEKLAEQLDVLAKDEQSEKFVTITVDAERIRVIMEEPILFGSGDWRLKSKAKLFLHKLTGILKEIPQQIVVEGHTDSIPMRSSRMMSNWELSAARAYSVINYLVKKENIPPERLSAVGYGQFKPVAANDTPANRALNRRVEINILRIK